MSNSVIKENVSKLLGSLDYIISNDDGFSVMFLARYVTPDGISIKTKVASLSYYGEGHMTMPKSRDIPSDLRMVPFLKAYGRAARVAEFLQTMNHKTKTNSNSAIRYDLTDSLSDVCIRPVEIVWARSGDNELAVALYGECQARTYETLSACLLDLGLVADCLQRHSIQYTAAGLDELCDNLAIDSEDDAEAFAAATRYCSYSSVL